MHDFLNWLHHDTSGLLTLCAAGVALLLLMIIRFKIEPFIALLVAGLGVALAAGLSPEQIVGTPQESSDSLLEKGVGSMLGHIAMIVGLGTMLGAMLESSGGADVLTRRLLRAFGERRAPLAMGLSGLILGVPVFFDIGVFVLAPLVYAAARRGEEHPSGDTTSGRATRTRRSGTSILLYCLPMLAALSMTHAFLPPHPGPVVAASLLGVDLGWLILMGLACGLPAWFVAGVLWSTWIGNRLHVPVPDGMAGTDGVRTTEEHTDQRPAPALSTVCFVIGLPMLLILGATVGSVTLPEGSLPLRILTFLGNPTVALTLALLLSFWLLGTRRGSSSQEIAAVTTRSLRPVGMLVLVIGAGGFFGKVLDATGVGDALAGSLAAAGLPLLVSAYVISSGLRIAQGSATVAIVTSGGIIAPIASGMGLSQPTLALIAVALAAGSITVSHVNDGAFWIISRYFGVSVKATLQSWTVLETILSLTAFGVAAALSLVV